MKLSKTQRKVMDKMEYDKWYSAYDLRCSVATLNALGNKGIVETKRLLGSYYFPRTNIEYRLKTI